MKKGIVLALVMSLVLAFGSVAYAAVVEPVAVHAHEEEVPGAACPSCGRGMIKVDFGSGWYCYDCDKGIW